jgi:hypothetical protein
VLPDFAPHSSNSSASSSSLEQRRSPKEVSGRSPRGLKKRAVIVFSFTKGVCIMADVVTELASRSGVSPDLAQKGLGAVLAFLKEKIPAEAFAKVSNAVPDADGLMAAAEADQKESGGGMLGAVTGAVGKLLGGSGSGALVAKLTQFGFAPEQVQKFLKNALDFLKDKVPGDVLKQVSGLFPT